ncbi:nucleolar protein 8 isoform X2 [Thunnus albacares]|uniref:nucleolar protein 8 isoform X2 n=1 Tax=Thunnus albacares TaxID=8236 RepID=UPI001CF6678E|nr:nucleolar protein 8 isoform X2 [Thunnus albacares]
MRRLYVGGLSHSITQKDLKDRFGKFGVVEDVELRTRKDDEGVPYKTFGYININISDADLKKCMTVLNKSKWKGGTLQIETAKESFLHRLAEERQEAEEQRLQQPAAEDKRQKMLDSLSKAGVHDFTMKAAVPGTEIPGHKDWVVSKFGRVLPVLQLSCRKGSKARTLKYDPSKYSHNIRRLNPPTEDEPTPVAQLTWEVPGGDDDISKKRRGEFPPYQPPRPKKSRTDVVISRNAVGRIGFEKIESVNNTEAHRVTNGFELPTYHRLAQRRGALVADSDDDSDEEIRRLVAVQQSSHGALWQEAEEDNLEVVGHDYLVKSGLSGQQQKGRPDDKDEEDYDSADTDELFASRKPPPQEKLTQLAAEDISGNNTDRKRKTKKKNKAGEQEEEEEKYDSSDAEEHLPSRKPSSSQHREDSGKQGSSSENQSKKMTVLPVVKPPSSESDSDEEDDDESDDDEDDEELESADSDSDLDYEAMFSNVTRLEISLADLQKLAEASQETSDTTSPSMLSAQETNLTSDPAERPAPKKGTMPEEILAAIMEEDSSEDERKKKKKKRKDVTATLLPAFQGTRALNEGSETDECQKRQKEEEEEGSAVKKQKLDSEASQLNHKATDSKTSRTLSGQKHTETDKMMSQSSEEDEEEEEEEEEKREELVKSMGTPKVLKKAPTKVPVNAEKAETGSSSSSDDEEEEDDEDEEEEEKIKASQSVLTAKAAAKASPSSSSSSSEEDEDEQEIPSAKDAVKAAPPPAADSESSSSEEEDEEEDEEEKVPAPPRVVLGAKEEEERQRKANMRRLAAVQQRQKEAEEHKKLIQGALANLDTPAAGAGKHIVFGSDDDDDDDDDEDDDEDKQQTPSEVTTSKKTLFQDSQSEDESTDDEAAANENGPTKEKVRLKPSGPQLFGNSEDEEDGDEEEDDSRFDIRPQFEGRAGQKLMELQSRFGTDDRFRMDSRFLEEDEDKEEESERKTSVTEEDEALEEERKKNLSILQSVLGSSQQTCSSKTTVKAKTFRDVSALHYDPSREEHAAFETKTDETKKESKSARRKKREEAQKLPDVSKEIFYDVSGDLKALFGQTKDDVAGGEEKTSWDQEEEEEEVDQGGKEEEQIPLSSLLSADTSAKTEESSGFKFSFFGDDTETGSTETAAAEYKVESIQAPKVSWQQDPRLQDSSSEEEEEEEEEEHEEKISTVAKTTEEETPSKKELLFFFYPEDSRLTEGPRLFCRSSQLEEQREQWEEMRSALRQEYRKKHKDARRKLKSSHRS